MPTARAKNPTFLKLPCDAVFGIPVQRKRCGFWNQTNLSSKAVSASYVLSDSGHIAPLSDTVFISSIKMEKQNLSCLF